MILGVGTDLVETRRIALVLERFGDRFVRRLLAEEEIRQDCAGPALAAYLARQFAAKEAISKALGTGMGEGVYFRALPVLRDNRGAPYLQPGRVVQDLMQARGAGRIHISLSDERGYALAFAVLEGPGCS